jgi:hypothetical protein
MKLHHRIPLLGLLCVSGAGCLQEFNPDAAKLAFTGEDSDGGSGGSGGARATTTASTTRTATSATTTSSSGAGGTTASGGAGGAGGEEEPPDVPPFIITPPIDFLSPDGAPASTGDPCEATSAHATTIFLLNCAGCHGGRNAGERQGQPPFDYILDLDKLLKARSATVPDPLAPPENQIPNTPNFQGMRFIVPGDPDHSRVYLRVTLKQMPPPPIVGMPDLLKSRPNVSDFSVLREWITNCLEVPEEPGDGGTGGDDGGP